MQFDELGRKLRDNPGIILAAAAVLSVIIIVAGLAIGLAKRNAKSDLEPVTQGKTPERAADAEAGFLLPDPVQPPGEEDPYVYYLETNGPDLELLSVRVSDLLKNRSLGVEVDFQPFVFNGEELGILRPADELAEP
jgi:hypothetical protein